MLKVNNAVPPGSAVREQERKRSSSAAWAGGQCVCPKCSYKLPRVAEQLCNQSVSQVWGKNGSSIIRVLST